MPSDGGQRTGASQCLIATVSVVKAEDHSVSESRPTALRRGCLLPVSTGGTGGTFYTRSGPASGLDASGAGRAAGPPGGSGAGGAAAGAAGEVRRNRRRSGWSRRGGRASVRRLDAAWSRGRGAVASGVAERTQIRLFLRKINDLRAYGEGGERRRA